MSKENNMSNATLTSQFCTFIFVCKSQRKEQYKVPKQVFQKQKIHLHFSAWFSQKKNLIKMFLGLNLFSTIISHNP